MQATSLAIVVALTAVSVAAVPLVSAADCIPCGPVNNVCRKAFHVDCLASDQFGSVGSPAAGIPVVPAVHLPAAVPDEAADVRCAGLPCDVINLVCEVALGGPCVR